MADDALLNCRSLVQLLSDSLRRTEDAVRALQGLEPALDADALSDACADARDEAEDLSGTLEDLRARTSTALVELESDARAHDAAVAAVAAAAREQEGTAAVELEDAARAVEAAFDRLTGEDLAVLEHELARWSEAFAAAAARLAPDADALVQAFAAAAGTIGAEQARTRAELGSLEHHLEDAGTAAGTTWIPSPLLDEIEGAAQAATAAFAEAAAEWELELTGAGEALHAVVGELAEDLARVIADGAAAVENAADAIDVAAPSLLAELDQVTADVGDAQPTLDEAVAAAARIPAIDADVEWIGQVLAALDGQ